MGAEKRFVRFAMSQGVGSWWMGRVEPLLENSPRLGEELFDNTRGLFLSRNLSCCGVSYQNLKNSISFF